MGTVGQITTPADRGVEGSGMSQARRLKAFSALWRLCAKRKVSTALLDGAVWRSQGDISPECQKELPTIPRLKTESGDEQEYSRSRSGGDAQSHVKRA